MNEIKALIAELRKNPLSSITALCIATIAYLAMYIKDISQAHSKEIEAAKREIIDTERRCALELDAVRKEQIFSADKEAAERQTKIENEIRKLLKQ
jgi:hypothetical protein